MTLMRLTPEIDLTGLPIGQVRESITERADGLRVLIDPVEVVRRPDLELARRVSRWVDPGEHRGARSRTCLARRHSHALNQA